MTGASKPESTISLEKLIRDNYGLLTANERKLADVVLDFPGDLAAYTATELSLRAGVSKATTTRFFKRLGFEGYEAARRLARERMEWGAPLYMQTTARQRSKGKDRIAQYLAEEVDSLTTTLVDLLPDTLDEICARIVSARKIWILGYRSSHFLAGYARWQFSQFREDVSLLPVAGETIGEHVAHMGPEDLLLVVGIRRRVPSLIQIMEAAKERGTAILYLSDPTAGKTTKLADWFIRCDVSSSDPFDTYSPALSVLRLLKIEAFGRSGATGRKFAKEIENAHERMNDLD